ncbi:hypothetical protein [Austwickia chelonae]|uniref:DUF7847 domain-containing protein n=1 Tax=Austwickia chelonae TaxID=100225 RepID=UPI0013C2E2EF|nr:hypothetical protein [Austwickia chelonae]
MSQRDSLAVPGPPSAETTGPVYGARYGDPVYDAQWGLSDGSVTARPGRLADGPVGLPDMSAPPRAGARLLTFRPGVVTLRPLSINDIIDGAIRTVRRRPALFIGVAALGIAVATVVRAAIDVSVGVTLLSSPGQIVRISPSFAVKPVLALLIAGLLAVPTADAVLGRRPSWPRVKEALSAHRFSLLRLVAVIAVVTGSTASAIWVMTGGRNAQLTDLTMVLAVLSLIQFVLLVPFFAAPAVSVIEGAGPVRALRRSFDLMRGSLGRAFLVMLTGKVLVAVMMTVIATPSLIAITILSMASGYNLLESSWAPALNTLLDLLVDSLSLPFEAVLYALFYIDLRVRNEGLDVLLVNEARRGADR